MHRAKWLAALLAAALLAVLTVVTTAQPVDPPAGEGYEIRPGDTLFTISQRFDKPLLCLQRANELTGITLPDDVKELFIPDDCQPFLSEDFVPGETEVEAPVTEGTPTPEVLPEEEATSTPVAETGTSDPDQPTSYTVERGDRLIKIAEALAVPLACLIQANGIANPDLIYVGQVLRVPANCDDLGAGGGTAPGGVVGSANAICRFDRNPNRVTSNGQYVVQAGDSMDFIACDFGVQLECLVAANPQIANPARLLIGDTLTINLACPAWVDPTLPR
jgi:LysM repeat protein